MRLKAIAISLCCLVGTSCVPRKDAFLRRDPLERAYQKIDQGQVDEAIVDLTDLKNRDSRPEVREALASAYALRAGLRVEKYWGFLVGFRAPLMTTEKIEQSKTMKEWRQLWGQLAGNEALGQTEWKDPEGLAALAKTLATAEIWRERILLLPQITETAEVDLLRALDVLRDHPKPGARLYRALLGLIILRHRAELGFDGWNQLEALLRGALLDPGALQNLSCRMSLESFQKWGVSLFEIFSEAGQDLSVAFPSQKKDFHNAVTFSQTVIQQLNTQNVPESCQ